MQFSLTCDLLMMLHARARARERARARMCTHSKFILVDIVWNVY